MASRWGLSGRTLPAWKHVVYGLGSFGASMMTATIVTWLLFYATGAKDAGGVGHGYFGLAMGAGRVIDALADPFVGRWSDRVKNPRLGRRLPFVLGAAIPMGLVFALLWLPYEGEPPHVRALRIGVALSAFFALYTVVVCPYLAMLAEVTSPKTRMQMAAWQAAGSIAGGATVVLTSGRLFDEVGFPAGGALIGVLAVCCFMAVGIVFARERQPAPANGGGTAEQNGRQGEGPLRAAWRLVADEPAFRMYLMGDAALWIGLNMLSISLPYLVTAMLAMPASGVGRLGLINVAGTAATIPVVTRLALQYGKVGLLRVASAGLGLLLPLIAIGPTGVWLIAGLSGPLLACVYTLHNPILAEITDHRRRITGDGQEALHFGAQGMVLKGALAFAVWLAASIFALLGAAPGYDTGLRVIGVLAGLCCLLGSFFLGRVGKLLSGQSQQA